MKNPLFPLSKAATIILCIVWSLGFAWFDYSINWTFAHSSFTQDAILAPMIVMGISSGFAFAVFFGFLAVARLEIPSTKIMYWKYPLINFGITAVFVAIGILMLR